MTVETIIKHLCPDWCGLLDSDHHHAIREPYHQGPRFGEIVDVYGENAGDHLAVLASVDKLDEATPAQLRQLAADCLAAAEWIEAHQ